MKTVILFVRYMVAIIICGSTCLAQQSQDWLLEKMPVDLEIDFALSALPLHLRDQATVYLLDPKKGYYVARQGTNGFSTFVNRTEWEWEWAEFVQDTYGAISYDAEGSKTHLPVFFDVAEMRASGKYTPAQIRDIIVKRVNEGKYKAPSRAGISYMLSPLLRTHPGTKEIINMVMPHFMFYAPGVDNSDIGGGYRDGHQPFVVDSGGILDKNHSIFNYIILAAGETEKAKIVEEQKDLLRRLGEYKSYLKVEPNVSMSHH